MNLLSDGVAWLQEERKQSLSDTGVYQRGAFTIPNLAATRGKPEFTINADATVQLENNLVDWIVTASELVLDGQVTLPKRGDRFTVAGVIHEVMQPDTASRPYNLDQTGQQLRIHTRPLSG